MYVLPLIVYHSNTMAGMHLYVVTTGQKNKVVLSVAAALKRKEDYLSPKLHNTENIKKLSNGVKAQETTIADQC